MLNVFVRKLTLWGFRWENDIWPCVIFVWVSIGETSVWSGWNGSAWNCSFIVIHFIYITHTQSPQPFMPAGINVKYQTTLRVINSEKKSSHIKCGFCHGGSCVCHERWSFGQPTCSDKPSLDMAALVNCVVLIYFIYRIRYLHHEIITEEYNWQGALNNTCLIIYHQRTVDASVIILHVLFCAWVGYHVVNMMASVRWWLPNMADVSCPG